MDAMDAVLVDLSTTFPKLIGQISLPMPGRLRAGLLALCQSSENEIEAMCVCDLAIARLSAEAVNALLGQTNIAANTIRAIGSHGQTIRHLPQIGNTLQIGNPSLIAELTGIATVADFRRRDMAAGGEGAPLVPAFHEAIFRSPEQTRVVANIGGIANITVLPAASDQPVIGFDTGPGNTLMDDWCHRHLGQPFDENGEWAASGNACQPLLDNMLADPFFARLPPKSTGKEYFHHAWLQYHLTEFTKIGGAVLAPEDIQATLAALTAHSLADMIRKHAPVGSGVYVCGGGAHNGLLMQSLTSLLSGYAITTTDDLGLAHQWVEATAFAWLARQTINNLPGNLPAVTNASGPRILGGIYPA